MYMKRLNQTESPIFMILCVLCFQRQSFFYVYFASLSLFFVVCTAFLLNIRKPHLLILLVIKIEKRPDCFFFASKMLVFPVHTHVCFFIR